MFDAGFSTLTTSGAYIALGLALGIEMFDATPVMVLTVVEELAVDEVVDPPAELEPDEEVPVAPVEPAPVTVVV